MRKVAVLGAGSWGIALAKLLCENGNQVVVWSVMEDEIAMLKERHEHVDKLPGVPLPESIEYTTDLGEAVAGSEYIILAVPSVHTRSVARSLSPLVGECQTIVCVAKGIEEDTLMTISSIVEQEVPRAAVAVMCGPSHAEEVGIGLPTTVVAGASSRAVAEGVQNLFMNDVFRVYTSPDVLGMELGGALKNVIALAAGMADGLGCGDNTKAALITRGISEISRLACAMGARQETLGGLTGIGDLIVTCESRHSRNRKAGMLIGQGRTMQQAMDEVSMVVEGVYSAKAAVALARQYGVDMPIIEEVNAVLFEGKPARDALRDLMRRERRSEHGSLDWGADGVAVAPCGYAAGAALERCPAIRIRYLVPGLERVAPARDRGDWIDLRSAEDVSLKKGEFRKIRLGVAMQLPAGYEAVIVPRSSTFENFGLIQTNHMGVIDESYCGDGDEWMMPVLATRDAEIRFNDRICQFRIQRHQPDVAFSVVPRLGNENRGGFGSTGIR